MTTFKRSEFSGLTDKYMFPTEVPSTPVDLSEAIKGVAPADVSGSVLSDGYVNRASERLSGYRHYWRFYQGRQWTVEYDGGDRKPVYNYCKKVVNKRASWLTGRGFRLISQKGNETVATLFEKVWAKNRGRSLIRRTSKFSFCFGDGFWYFTPQTKDAYGNPLPKERWFVRIVPLNPQFCFPIWSEQDPNVMAAFLLQFPVWDSGGSRTRLFSCLMDVEKVQYYLDNDKVGTVANPLGVIPVVHIPHDPQGDQLFGTSLLHNVTDLNEEYNNTSLSIKKIIKYHGEPTTIVYGARMGAMERAANKVWSNLPPPDQAKVENLEMHSDLTVYLEYLTRIEANIYELARTPRIAYDFQNIRVSNTSGIAIQLMFQPLIEATLDEQDQYTEAITLGNEIIYRIHLHIFGEDLTQLGDDAYRGLEMEVQWISMLPKDEQIEMDLALKKISSGIWSKAEAIRRLSGVRDTEKLALELAADRQDEVGYVEQRARAEAMKPWNYSASFLGSPFLSEDLIDTASQVGEFSAAETDTGDDGPENGSSPDSEEDSGGDSRESDGNGSVDEP